MNPHDRSHLKPAPTEIRLLTDADLPGLTALLSNLAEAFNPAGVGPGLPEQEAQAIYKTYQGQTGRAYWVLVNTRTQAVLGGAGVLPRENVALEAGVGELRDLLLHPLQQGNGKGRELVQFCLNKAAELGYRQVYLASKTKPTIGQDSGLRFFRSGRAVRVTCLPNPAMD